MLGVNGGSLADAVFTLVLTDADTVAVGARELQERTLVLRGTYSSTGKFVHEVRFYLRNVAQVAN